jgi:GT2 family glycosyltransferase/2-polyprenyl-3-methyl-5-hydroxy-6-metoxy-1,4-benzoquinol methylase
MKNLTYSYDKESRVYCRTGDAHFGYNDGDATESVILNAIRASHDLSTGSEELMQYISDWPTLYHLSPSRANLLRPLEEGLQGKKVLELGSGCGAISRYLGELGCDLTCVEGSRRRAVITASRCRDMDNVTVYNDNFQDFDTEEQFDVVTLIGVLEYSRKFIGGSDPIGKALALARSFLKPDGVLLVAIENKLGLKYWAGAYEDHQGIPFYGIESLYAENEAITFGRADLANILQNAEFSELEFFYPYPDYKLPSLVLSELALSQPQPLLMNLLSGVFAPVQSRSYQRVFSEGAAFRGLVENGLVGDLANSFLVVAKKGASDWSTDPGNVAFTYSQVRRQEFSKEVRIHRKDNVLQVNRRLLTESDKNLGWMTFPDSEPLLDGEILFNSLLILVNREGWGCSQLAEWLRPLLEILQQHSQKSGGRSVLPGNFFDATPFNLVIESSGKAALFDLEWAPWPEVDLVHLLYRGIYHSLARVGTVAQPSSGTPLTLATLSAEVLNVLLHEPIDIDEYLSKEAEFLQAVSGKNSSLQGLKSVSLEVRVSPTRLRESLAQAQKTIDDLRMGISSTDVSGLGSLQRDDEVALIAEMENLVNRAIQSACYAERKFIQSSLRKDLQSKIKQLSREPSLSNPLERCLQMLKSTLNHDDYQQWIARHELREVDAEVLAERMVLHWHQHPVMHCFMFVLPGEEHLLADTIDSLAGQLLKSWHLTVVGFAAAPDILFEQADFLHWRTLSESEDPYEALNQELAKYSSHWVSFIEPGMQYSPESLAKVADTINLHPDCSFIYTDDDQVDATGMRCFPRFKPSFNLDLLRSTPYIGNGWVPAGHLIQAGGIRALPGAENYDLALRWFDIFGESAFVHVADVLTHKSGVVERPFDSKAGEIALGQHFERRQITVDIAAGYVDNSYRVTYLHDSQPKVSIIIPTKDKLEFFQPCIESLLDKTTYPNYEVLVVDNQSTDPDTHSYYQQLQASHPDRVRVLSFDQPFNFSEMNNWAAEQATGDYLLLLNNDTEIIQPEWLDRMMNHGQRDDVAVVGARLLYPETGRIQHAGVILGMSEIADHPFNNQLTLNSGSYMERARLDQNYSAVTAAVMLIRRDVYAELGGMDSDNLAVLFNDVDFCIRAGQQGYRIVWTPFAMAIHHGSASLKGTRQHSFYFDIDGHAQKAARTRKEQRYMLSTWLPLLANDPAYNKNLSLRSFEYQIDLNAPQNWEVEHHLRLRVYGLPVRGGSGDYRIKQPFSSLAQTGMALCEFGASHLNITELERLKPDTVVVQNAISDQEIELLQLYREFKPEVQIVFMLDDLLHDLPEKSSQYRKMKAAYRDARSRLRKVLGYCDRLIVSTQPLADMCSEMIHDIRVIPNCLQIEPWQGLKSLRAVSEKPRVGWAGAQQHQGDLELIIDVVKETSDEVDWVFFGMCPDEIKPYVKEVHDFVDIESYPQKLASLNLDLAVAPLEDNDFNVAKSNLRLLEYGMMGWPVVCSDIYPYQTNHAPVHRVANTKADWLAAIRQILADPKALQQSGDELKAWVMTNYLLEDHLHEWFSALATEEFLEKETAQRVS